MFTWSMLGSAAAIVVAAFGYTRATLIGAVLVLGLAASVGRRALDSTIQRFAPHARRGRVYASLETRLELAWVAAACVAVASRFTTLVGVLVLAGFLVVTAAAHVRRHHLHELLEPHTTAPLAERLITRAETLAGLDHYDEAIVVALSAIDVTEAPAGDPELLQVRELVRGPATHDDLRKASERVISRVRALVQNQS